MTTLDGRVAIVTGAGAGLGRAHALALAEAGASVIVNDLDGGAAEAVVKEVVAGGGRATANGASVADVSAAQGLVEQAVADHGDLHIVVNNAGLTRDTMSFNMGEEQWDLVVDVHLKGHWAVSRAAGAWWRAEAKQGRTAPRRIVNTASEAGLWGSAGQTNYAAAKAGIIGLTLTLAREYERFGVTANAIAPRARTGMTAALDFMNPPQDGGFDTYEPANVSPVVVWLAGDGAADVNGQVFVVVGSDVQVVAPATIAGTVTAEGRWTAEGLAGAKAELFAGRSSAIPPFGG